MGNWVRILFSEDMLRLDDVKVIANIPGGLLPED